MGVTIAQVFLTWMIGFAIVFGTQGDMNHPGVFCVGIMSSFVLISLISSKFMLSGKISEVNSMVKSTDKFTQKTAELYKLRQCLKNRDLS